MPEIGLNGLLLDYPHSGTAVYTRNLVRHLPNAAPDLSFRVYVRHAGIDSKSVPAEFLTTPFGKVNRGRGVGARLDKFTWETIALPLVSAMRRDTVLHSLYFAAPPLAAAPVVVTIHDLIPLVLHKYRRTRQSAAYSRFMAWSARSARAIVTVSNHSKRDIVRVLDVPEERVHVTYEAVDERFVPQSELTSLSDMREKYQLPEQYVLYTGGAERRKNVETLVRAWKQAWPKLRTKDVYLVVVADFPPPDALYPDIRGLARDLELPNVIFLRHIEEQDKPDLYRAATLFCFPSLYEGFGFTPLEAMASGTPVIVSNAASLPEVVDDGGVLLPPEDISAWADAIVELFLSGTLRAGIARRGLTAAARFSWARTAEETSHIYRQVINS